MVKSIRKPNLQCAAVIAVLFLLTSTAYMAWTYHIVELAAVPVSDVVTLVAAYLFQAVGIGLFSVLLRRGEELIRKTIYIALCLHLFFFIMSIFSSTLAQKTAFGCMQNLFCGWIAGYYLYRLATISEKARIATILGIGYSTSILVSWLFSHMGSLLHSRNSLLVLCLMLTAVAVLVIRMESLPGNDTSYVSDVAKDAASLAMNPLPPQDMSTTQCIVMVGAVIFLFSTVKGCGFGFPSEDLKGGINVEFFRLFYAAGLLMAGIISDKNRRYGAVCAAIALVIPFVMLSIRGDSVSGSILWSLSYFTFGFFSVFRIILFSDISQGEGLLPLCGFGILIGRIGDAAGEMLCLGLSAYHPVLVGIATLLFIIAMLVFFRLYPVLYLPVPKKQKSEQEIFDHFSDTHNLSAREREVLQFLLNKKTNQEIAEELCISDGTVKYHIHNLLKKTNCPNRMKLLSFYAAEQNS